MEYYSGAISAGDCISNAWELIKKNYGLYFGVSVLATIILACVPCVNIFIAGPIMCGVYFVYLKGIGGDAPEFGEMFKGFENFLPAMVVGLIQTLPSFMIQVGSNVVDLARIFGDMQGGGSPNYYQAEPVAAGLSIFMIVLGLVGTVIALFIYITFFFSYPLIIDKKLGIGDAIKYSAKAGWSNLGGLILLGIIQLLILVGGTLVCLIGILFVMPILHASSAFAYRQVFPDTGGQQPFTDAPPPPSAYQGGFGTGL